MSVVSAAVSSPVRLRIAKVVRRMRRLPLIPILILSIVVITGITAPWISPHSPTTAPLADRKMPPFWSSEGNAGHLLGTDQLGRDILTRIFHGARISLIVTAVTLGIGGTVGTALGLMAGWYGGLVDEVIMRMVDVFLSLPIVLIALVMVVSLGPSLSIIIVVLALWIWVRFARMVRGEVLKLKTLAYVDLARVAGASTFRLLAKHIFPGTVNTLIVVATLQVGTVILLESALSFLGAGVPPPTPAWGSMVSDGRNLLADAWWISTMPGLAIVLTVMSLNLVGDWLRDTLDPELRQLD